MANYRKKPVTIQAWPVSELLDAFKREWSALPKPVAEANEAGSFLILPGAILVSTLEGQMTAAPTDMLICGVRGEFYPCKPDIFAATYEEAT